MWLAGSCDSQVRVVVFVMCLSVIFFTLACDFQSARVGVSVQYQRVAAVRDGLREAILGWSEEEQRWSARSLRPRPPCFGRACALQLTLMGRHQQIQMLLGEIWPDGHHLFP